MLARVAIVLVVVSAFAAVSAPALAADPIIARDTLIRSIWPLDGDLVYARGEALQPLPDRVWMARYRGRLHEAHGIPREASGGEIGRDAKGRKVFTFAVDGKWFVYDLARNRTRPLSVPSDCDVSWLSLWRGSMAYEAKCKGDQDFAVFLRNGKRTLRVRSAGGALALTYRAGALAALVEDGLDNQYLEQWAANGKRCITGIDSAFGDATSNDLWFPTNLWIVNGYVTWTMGEFKVRPDFAILAAKVRPGCKEPGPVGLFPFRPDTTKLRTFAVDERRVFYAYDTTLRRHALKSKPSLAPPRNDNFKNAHVLSGAAPLSAKGRLAHATVQRKEPLSETKHTVWYRYRPTKSGTVYVTVTPSCSNPPNCGGSARFGAYTGTKVNKLTGLTQYGGPYSSRYTRVDAVKGKTYWISVGAAGSEPDYEPFTVRIEASPPH
jgi:hypothetical protein